MYNASQEIKCVLELFCRYNQWLWHFCDYRCRLWDLN